MSRFAVGVIAAVLMASSVGACASERVSIVDIGTDGGAPDGAQIDRAVGVETDGGADADADADAAPTDDAADAAIAPDTSPTPWCPGGSEIAAAPNSEANMDSCSGIFPQGDAKCAACGGGFGFSCFTYNSDLRGTFPETISNADLARCRTASGDGHTTVTCCEAPQCIWTMTNSPDVLTACAGASDGGTARPVSCSVRADGVVATAPAARTFKNCFKFPAQVAGSQTHCCE